MGERWRVSSFPVVLSVIAGRYLKFFVGFCAHFTGGWRQIKVSSTAQGPEGPGFKSQLRRCQVTVLGKLFTPFVLCSPSNEIGSSPLKGCGGNY